MLWVVFLITDAKNHVDLRPNKVRNSDILESFNVLVFIFNLLENLAEALALKEISDIEHVLKQKNRSSF